ncbi:MAG: ABC transporter permease [Eubacteriales bacterium]|nr:ABC transporter permease [Eubacteriales bacterium]MDD3881401.1 ABC transporter permease [Eubacteriales bacterium]MDD4513088.1 ABC transporter permease [Eubacteriales bacterium]
MSGEAKSGNSYLIDKSIIGCVRHVSRELFANRMRVWRLARFEKKAKQSGTFFSSAWNILNPAFQIFVYWFVFSVGLNVKSMRDGVPYAVWLMSGILPWFFINGSMMQSTVSIVGAAGMLKSIKFPLSAVPAKSVVANLIDHLWTVLILVPVILLSGVRVTASILYLPYYMLAAFAFLISFGLLASALDTVFKDFSQFLSPILRLTMYISSVVWSIDNLSPTLSSLMRLNPLTYIIEGYRDSLLYAGSPFAQPLRTLGFWVFTALLYCLGSFIHCRLREKFVDEI